VLAWLTRHPRWTFHFTPTSASWLNAVENFFSKMTRQRIRREVCRSIADLQTAINAYLAEHNASPKPFVWTKIRRRYFGRTRPLSCTIRLIQCTRDRQFESTSLQRTVGVSRDIPLLRRKAGLFPRVCGAEQAARSGETGVARSYRADRRQYLCRAKFQYRSVDGGDG
jgi:hypothetical protein